MEGDVIEDTAHVEMVDEGLQAWYFGSYAKAHKSITIQHVLAGFRKYQGPLRKRLSINKRAYGNHTESLVRANSGPLKAEDG